MSTKELLDDIDKKIIDLLQEDTTLTHSKIAEQLDRSQPAIGARIKKMTEKGILATQIGVDFQKMTELNLVKVSMKTTRAEDIMELAQCCPFILNAMKTSGDYNIILFMASRNLKTLDNVVDRHFRNKDYVKKLAMDLITQSAKKLVFPVNFIIEDKVKIDDPCHDHPVCASAREAANLRSPEELNLV